MNAVVYVDAVARDHPMAPVSEEAQYALDAQERAARDYCRERDWQVVQVVREVTNAPWHLRLGMRQALTLLHEHAPCMLVVQNAEHLSHSAWEWLEMVEVVGESGNSIAYLT